MRVLVSLLVVALLAGCGTPERQPLPIFPNAIQQPRGQSAYADTLADQFLDQVGARVAGAGATIYALPAGTSWEQIWLFYSERLSGVWNAVPELWQDGDPLSIAGWRDGNRVAAIGFVPATGGEPPLVFVADYQQR